MKQFKNLDIVLTSKNPFNIDSISTTGFYSIMKYPDLYRVRQVKEITT